MLQLLYSKEINFPSASGIEFYQSNLYVFGDDARTMQVLSPTYTVIDSVAITDSGSYRISKNDKHDIESAMIYNVNGQPHVIGVGSMSANKRWGVAGYDLTSGKFYNAQFFDSTTHFKDVEMINIEGSCLAEPYVVFSNRANLSNPVNHLLFWNKRDSIGIKRLVLPATGKMAGVSGLYYVKEKDLLLFTASEEETANAIDDGAIGESYLGWVENFSKKMAEVELKPNRLMQLSTVDSVFVKQKIESVCVEKIEFDGITLHLASDNDNGSSRLFKMKLSLE